MSKEIKKSELKNISVCNPCFDGEHDECISKKCQCYCHRNYDRFIRAGLSAGFTDDQINFMWEYLALFEK